ncbi:ketoacyl-ACP synthase III family protein [Embleya sp. NPDC020886]|uniref:ketoacyl-ACP synthase III family protein n=1 Tax=Embleya sp. NPDC020886 TaxID=3363980 RepID=UPI0037BB345C
MRFDDIWLTGTGGTLGERTPVADAVAAGHYESEAAESTGMVSVAQARLAPPEMAVIAGRQAIKDAQEYGTVVDPGSLYLHSHGHFQGIDMWPAACWIAKELLGPRVDGIPTTVSAWSNGSLASIDIAAAMLASRPALPSALITLGDRFAPPTDRWHTSPGIVFGDGAAAAVLARGGGRLRLVSLVSETDTVLEGLSRGDEPFRTAPAELGDIRHRTRQFLARGEISIRDVQTRSADRTRSVVARALADAELEQEQIDWFVTPFVGSTLYRESFVRPLGITPRRDLHKLGLTIGHLGAADQIYALDHLLKADLLAPGARVLVIGTGMGFTFSAAVFATDRSRPRERKEGTPS